VLLQFTPQHSQRQSMSGISTSLTVRFKPSATLHGQTEIAALHLYAQAICTK
jgi:hypothetical protein